MAGSFPLAVPTRTDARRPRALFVALFGLIALALVACPVSAHADGFSMPNVKIDAEVKSDGSLHVVERRTFEFDDDVNGVFWDIPFAANKQGRTTSVAISSVSVDGRTFENVDSANKGEDGVYTAQKEGEGSNVTAKIMVFTPHDDESSANVTIDYTINGAVMAWGDTGEVYWKFIGAGWDQASENVSCTISFDKNLAAATPATKTTLRAWGHGSFDGEVKPSPQKAKVTYRVPKVYGGDFAEARIVFPTAWVPNLKSETTPRLDTVLSEEKRWAEEANAKRERARAESKRNVVISIVVAVLYAGTIIALKVIRFTPRSEFNETYFRDIPSADHPAVIATFMCNGQLPDQAFVAGLMKLTDDRVIKLESVTTTNEGLLGAKTKEDYKVTMTKDAYEQAKAAGKIDEIDDAILDFMFVGRGYEGTVPAKSRTFSAFKEYPIEHTDAYGDAAENYQTTVKAQLELRGYIQSRGLLAGLLIGITGMSFFGLDLMLAAFTNFALPNVVALVISGVIIFGVVFFVGSRFRRLSAEGTELRSKCEALKRWLEDFTRLNEAVPADLILWNKLMVMAVALGVSKKTLKELADAVPAEIRESGDFYDYYPVYWWCHSHGDLDMPTSSIRSAYRDNIATLASSSNSSVGGFGGGFSGGGGGGVGGGGGGTF